MTQTEYGAIKQIVNRYRVEPDPELIGQIPEFFETDAVNTFSANGGLPFKALIFNMEAGTRLENILRYMKRHPHLQGADVILANELDWGMARSGNRHITREIASALGMNYVFGLEFITASAGENGNTLGRHGNAIFSKYIMTDIKILRLPAQYDWFYHENDCRLGNRIALLAKIKPEETEIGLVCVHLENRADPIQRARQFSWLLERVQEHFGDMPVLIGGDMNTNTVDGNEDETFYELRGNEAEQKRRIANISEYEPLMGLAERYGYSCSDCNLMDKSTRRKPMPDGSCIRLNLDWFFQKGLICEDPQRVDTVFNHRELAGVPADCAIYDGQELSDHDAVVVTCMSERLTRRSNDA